MASIPLILLSGGGGRRQLDLNPVFLGYPDDMFNLLWCWPPRLWRQLSSAIGWLSCFRKKLVHSGWHRNGE
jgi:hypothetical protein